MVVLRRTVCLALKRAVGIEKLSAYVKIDLLLIWLHCRQLADTSATRLRPLSQWEVFLSNLRTLTGISNRPTKVRRSALRVKTNNTYSPTFTLLWSRIFFYLVRSSLPSVDSSGWGSCKVNLVALGTLFCRLVLNVYVTFNTPRLREIVSSDCV